MITYQTSHSLESIIRESLLTFAEKVARTDWRGREREAVSLFAFGFLVPRCRPGTVLYDPAQFGLDVAVSQPPGPNRKPQVCKDLVIWPKPSMVCWDSTGRPTHRPLTILEWKARTGKVSSSDEAWLLEYSATAPPFTGFAIAFNPRGAETTLVASRVREGVITRDWINYRAALPSP